MKKFGLIGNDIGNSCSPALFKAAYGGKMKYELIDGENFASLLERFRKEDFAAVNITAPFKEKAFEEADQREDAALLCNAANVLIKNPDGTLTADNSDLDGVSLSIMSAYELAGVEVDDEDEFDSFLAEKNALVVGCGGAGKAAAAAVVTLGYGKTTVIDRHPDKAEAFCSHLRNFFGDIGRDELIASDFDGFEEAFRRADLVVYTLPGGAVAEDAQVKNLIESAGKTEASREKIVLEANYSDPCLEQYSTRFTYLSGLNWLFNQASTGFQLMTGAEPDEEAMKKIMETTH